MGGILSHALAGPEEVESSESSVLKFHSPDLWQVHFDASKQTNKLIVVDFTASWCGPCKFIAPVFSDMASKYTNIDFVKIDVDELSGVAREFQVQAMPTFVFFKQGKIVDKVVGADEDELKRKILKHGEVPGFAA